MSLLTHSIRIKRLDLKTAMSVASADADFSRLAYYQQEEARIINAGNPFVSNTVCSRPFEQATSLRQGVHLHFILPQAITHFYEDAAKVLPAPNRWLVKKLKGKKVLKSWVLESDFLAEQTEINGQVNTILPVDLNREDFRVFKDSTQPFRYLGRLLPAEDYFSKNYQLGATYWEDFMSEGEVKRPFTAFAYGNLNFASFYPNCHSVFGFHDLGGLPEHEYQVFGWYSSAEQKDQAPRYLQALKDFASTDPAPGPAVWENEYGLEKPTPSALNNSNQLLFYGKAIKQDQELALGEVKLAMGNDVEEAFSAFVAGQKLPGDTDAQRKLENQLEAIQFGLLGIQDLDLKPNFEARRHARTFKAHQGNTFLGLELFSPKKAATREQRQKQLWQLEQEIEGHEKATLHRLRDALSEINALLLQYEQQLNQVKSRQHLLHAHWQKYLEAAHPPMGMAHLLPNPDATLVFIRDQAIKELRELMEKTGLLRVSPAKDQSNTLPANTVELQIAEEDQWEQKQEVISRAWHFTGEAHAPVKQFDESLAAKVIAYLKLLEPLLNELNELPPLTDHGSEFCLKFELGQRFFEPSIPTLLLASKAFKPNHLVHAEREDEEDGTVTGTQDKWLLHIGSIPSGDGPFRGYLKSLLDTTPDYVANLEVVAEITQPAHLDWELYFYPVDKVGTGKRKYRSDFIEHSFGLKQNSPEFKIKGQGSYTTAVSRYTGRSSLMASDGRILTDKIKAMPETVRQSEALAGVTDLVENHGYLVQALTGFNQAFSQQKDSMQLPIGDPVAFEDFKQIYRQMDIASYIAGQRQASPVADFDFNAVRAGGANISRIHLIDSFGRTYPVGGEALAVAVPETMTPPKITGNLPKIQAFFFPRFMQPVALRAHWLAAGPSADKSLLHANTNESPVSGWVVYNALYHGLMFFNTGGEHVCSLVYKAEEVTRLPPPEAAVTPTDAYLEHFVSLLEHNNHFPQVLETIKAALYHIDPAGNTGNEHLNLLFGRPLALARMSVNFELKGDYLCRMDHGSFNKMLKQSDAKPVTADYEKVEIPIRIGDYRKLNDGVVLCWQEPEDLASTAQGLTSVRFTNSSIELGEGKPRGVIDSHFTTQSLDDKTQCYGLLMDPRAEVHLCTGAVPMTILRMPERYWKKAMQELRYNLRLGPLIFPQDQIMFDLPRGDGKCWAWLNQLPGGLQKTPEQLAIHKDGYRQGLTGPNNEGLKGWEELIKSKVLLPGVFGEADYALVELKKMQELHKQEGGPYYGMMDEYLTLFEQYGTQIGPFSRDPVWLQNELHEGWAQLYPDLDNNANT